MEFGLLEFGLLEFGGGYGLCLSVFEYMGGSVFDSGIRRSE